MSLCFSSTATLVSSQEVSIARVSNVRCFCRHCIVLVPVRRRFRRASSIGNICRHGSVCGARLEYVLQAAETLVCQAMIYTSRVLSLSPSGTTFKPPTTGRKAIFPAVSTSYREFIPIWLSCLKSNCSRENSGITSAHTDMQKNRLWYQDINPPVSILGNEHHAPLRIYSISEAHKVFKSNFSPTSPSLTVHSFSIVAGSFA